MANFRKPSPVSSFPLPATSSLWSHGFVPYLIDASIRSNDRAYAEVKRAISQWNARCDLRWLPREQVGAFPEQGLVVFEATKTACLSPVGRRGGRQMISCALPLETFHEGNALHEMGHAVGLYHEHQRPDRDNYVAVSLTGLSDDDADNFERKRRSEVVVVGDYDLTSVMHYPETTSWPYANGMNGTAVITGGIGGIPISVAGQRGGLSFEDIRVVEAMHGLGPGDTSWLTAGLHTLRT